MMMEILRRPIYRAYYYPQPYTHQPQIRTKQGLTKGYLGFIWSLFGAGGCMAGGSIGFYDQYLDPPTTLDHSFILW